MKKIIFLMLFIALTMSSIAQTIYLWNNVVMPNSNGLPMMDSIANERQYMVGNPSIDVYTPSKEENRGFAVLIIPGGGYARLAHIVSGVQIARYINSIGGTAFVLKYRLPISPDLKKSELGPIQDGQRALKIMRSLAATYNYKADKVGVFGTSAGGHLASWLGVSTTDYTEVRDSLYKHSYRPDFMILLSPVITLSDPYAHKGSRENLLGKNATKQEIDRLSTNLLVTKDTPPALLMHANDDKGVPSVNSVLFYSAMHENGLNASLHIFPNGGHNINLTKSPGTTAMWPAIVDGWLKETGIYQ